MRKTALLALLAALSMAPAAPVADPVGDRSAPAYRQALSSPLAITRREDRRRERKAERKAKKAEEKARNQPMPAPKVGPAPAAPAAGPRPVGGVAPGSKGNVDKNRRQLADADPDEIPTLKDTKGPGYWSACVLKSTGGEPVFGDNEAGKTYASTSVQLMLVLVANDEIAQGHLKPTDKIVLDAEDLSAGETAFSCEAGTEIPVSEAFRLLCVKPASNIASALARKIGGGSCAPVVDSLNRKAQALRLQDTVYYAPWSLTRGEKNGEKHFQTTSARDLAAIGLHIATQAPELIPYFGPAITKIGSASGKAKRYNPAGSFAKTGGPLAQADVLWQANNLYGGYGFLYVWKDAEGNPFAVAVLGASKLKAASPALLRFREMVIPPVLPE